MKTFRPGFAALDLDIREIYRTMGMAGAVPGPDMEAIVNDMLEQAGRNCQPEMAYTILPVDGIRNRELTLGETIFKTGPVITPFFQDATRVAVFIVTAGRQFEQWQHGLRQDGDIFREFVADAIGSEIAEAAARYISVRIEEEAASCNCRITNSYSPGYCGWSVREQKALFGLFPGDPCGVTLNDSCLMSPVKSVSGIAGIGEHVKKNAYGCDICGKKDCYKKRRA
ncbi:MAG: 5-methyltetrahydrofolate--homocysteine methyltransferase [Alistipes sp.]|nr:5-methyltetrahydrofolate--homocysteine methyltransferase [Alistipes sp.]